MSGNATIGRRVRQARESRAMTQNELAQAMGGAWSANLVSRIERGEYDNPGREKLEDLADALRVSVDWLLGRDALGQPLPDDISSLVQRLGRKDIWEMVIMKEGIAADRRLSEKDIEMLRRILEAVLESQA